MPKLGELAKLISGQLSGSPTIKIAGVSDFLSAKTSDLVFALEEKFINDAVSSNAAAVVAPANSIIKEKPAILVKNTRLALAKILALFENPLELEAGIHKTAVVHATAKIAKGAVIGAFSYIGPGVEIGENTIIYPQASVYANTKIGKRCVVHCGARLGVDGYGFVPEGGKFLKIPQIGKLIIGNDVEIFANTCIARGTIGNTIIGSRSKIDNLTHIAHNCEIGEDCAITGLVGFAGSVKLGRHVTVGGQAGFSGHQSVGDNTIIMARAGVTKDIPSNSVVSGFPAVDHKKEMETLAVMRRLPQILKKLK
ncbi:UDP-3-O-(3-hydroxymyristoyl)glucosamine N-acyltransferase [Candidatus Saganbacteria bacterium]|nr:UDP-3-O-(3-hydroxymyristoyl)glucosamine N-acyltransferase [Candidatus Saganbacteria bacterium]